MLWFARALCGCFDYALWDRTQFIACWLGLFFVHWDWHRPAIPANTSERSASCVDVFNAPLVLAAGAVLMMAISFGVIEPTLSDHLDDYLHVTNTEVVG